MIVLNAMPMDVRSLAQFNVPFANRLIIALKRAKTDTNLLIRMNVE